MKHFDFILLEAGNWCFQLVLKWRLQQINQIFSSGLIYEQWLFTRWICIRVCLELSLLVLVVDQKGDQDCSIPRILYAKRNKRDFPTRASTCGTGTVTCWGRTHWVPFCTAIQRGVTCKCFCTKKVWLRKHPKIIMIKVTFWDTSVFLGSFILSSKKEIGIFPSSTISLPIRCEFWRKTEMPVLEMIS